MRSLYIIGNAFGTPVILTCSFSKELLAQSLFFFLGGFYEQILRCAVRSVNWSAYRLNIFIQN